MPWVKLVGNPFEAGHIRARVMIQELDDLLMPCRVIPLEQNADEVKTDQYFRPITKIQKNLIKSAQGLTDGEEFVVRMTYQINENMCTWNENGK